MKQKRKQRYVIPALVENNEGQWELISDFPDFEVYSDEELSRVLQVSTLTIRKWKKGKIIPFKPTPGCYVYNVNAVVSSLKAYGYHQQSIGQQPTGHNR